MVAERRPPGQADQLRRAIRTSIPAVPATFDAVPTKFLYVPERHLRALDPDAMLVTGIRGAGKSFWWYMLQDRGIRDSVLKRQLDVSLGFGQGQNASWPDRDELQQLLSAGGAPRLLWKAVVLRQVAPHVHEFLDWVQWTQWTAANPSPVAAALREFDESLAADGRAHLVLFDAVDRTADSREAQEYLLSGLLQLVLELRSFRALRAKVFARPDMLEGSLVRGFSDASKVLASAVNLEWRTLDLYGLLFQYLGNAADSDAAKAFRQLAAPRSKHRESESTWDVPASLQEEASLQRSVFERIAGPYMGTNARRGMTYTWVPNHLADGLDAVSPRSFLAAIGKAAGVHSEHDYALHWNGLHEGVRHASKTRVDEIQEDLPWAHEAMRLLENLVVPCDRSQVFSAWRKGSLLKKGIKALPDQQEGVMAELKRTGILKVLPGERINIPDVYRLGFGLRRRGGFAPRR